MKNILVAGQSEAGIRRGLRVAADLSVASGARLSLAWVSKVSWPVEASVGLLSDQLFEPRHPRSPIPTFACAEQPAMDWLRDVADSVDEYWNDGENGGLDLVTARIARENPGLVIACGADLACALITQTRAPVWRMCKSQPDKAWYSVRRLRCTALDSRAIEWARLLAHSIGAELELAARSRDADIAVLSRGLRSTFTAPLAARMAHAVVVV